MLGAKGLALAAAIALRGKNGNDRPVPCLDTRSPTLARVDAKDFFRTAIEAETAVVRVSACLQDFYLHEHLQSWLGINGMQQELLTRAARRNRSGV